jgi:hypothetical protein
MTAFLSVEDGRIPPLQQTRVAAFLMSAHGALTRQLAIALPAQLHHGWQVEMHSQYAREMEILSLVARATSWTPDPSLALLLWRWEMSWLPRPVAEVADRTQGVLIDLAALGHALHTVIRPAALLPEGYPDSDPFGLAMRRVEFESGRLMQAQILFLKGPELVPVRGAVATAVDWRHSQVRELWTTMLQSMEIEPSSRHNLIPAYQAPAPPQAAKPANEVVRAP